MKRKMSFLMAALMLTSCFAQGVYASTVVAPASAGVIKSDRMLISVPSGEIFKLLGFDVTINGETITIKDSDHTVVLKNGESSFTTDGQAVTPDVPQQIIGDSYYIPVRAIAESVGATVEWKAATKVAIITYKGKSISVRRDLVFGNAIYNAYLAKIKEAQSTYSDSKYAGMCNYSIYDINNDGVPELIIYISENYEGCNAANASVYTFKNGEAVYCGEILGTSLTGLNEYNGKSALINMTLDGDYRAYIFDGQTIVEDSSFYVYYDEYNNTLSGDSIIEGTSASVSEFKDIFGSKIPQCLLTDTSGLDVLTVFSVISEDKVEDDIVAAYKKALAEAPAPTYIPASDPDYPTNYYWNKSKYSLYDIDKDGVPELIVTFELMYLEMAESVVYTYKDGKAQYCGYIPQISSDGYNVDGNNNTHCLGVAKYSGGNGAYVQNDPVVHYVGIVTLNGTTLSTDGKLYETEDETSILLEPDWAEQYDVSNLTPIENLKS